MSIIGAGKKLIVLGCGLSGLSYTHYLRNFLAFHKKTSLISKITLLEANSYMGGSIRSNVFDDNAVHELGPRSVRFFGARAQNTCVLMEQLGLSKRIVSLTARSAAGNERFIYKSGKLWKVPTSLPRIFFKLPDSESRLISCIKHDLFTKRMDCSKYEDDDPPLYDFVSYRFGKDAAENILDPLLRGITAGDARQLSTKALFGDVLAKEQIYGSVLKALNKPPAIAFEHDELFPHDINESKLLDHMEKEGVTSFNLSTGLQTLPEHLSNSLLNTNDDNVVSIYNRTKVEKINFNSTNLLEDPCSVEVQTVDGDKLTLGADHIISTLPAVDLLKILPSNMVPEHKRAFEFIDQIPHVPVGCVVIEYRDVGKLPDVVKSFGFLTHSKADSKILGLAFDSSMFPSIDKENNSFRMTAMIGGQWYKEILGTDDMDKVTNAQLEQIALEEVSKILKFNREPYRMSAYLWKSGIAQYRPGHVGRLHETRNRISKMKIPLTLLGQSYDGVAVNDVIFSARGAAAKFVGSL